MKHQYSIWVSKEEKESVDKLRKQGQTIIGIFRAGIALLSQDNDNTINSKIVPYKPNMDVLEASGN